MSIEEPQKFPMTFRAMKLMTWHESELASLLERMERGTVGYDAVQARLIEARDIIKNSTPT